MSSSDNPSEINRRLDTWKEIGAFFGRDERTVKRWEVTRGLPVHRVPGAGRANVYANTGELAEWLKGKRSVAGSELDTDSVADTDVAVFPDPLQLDDADAESAAVGAADNGATQEQLDGGFTAERRLGDRRTASPEISSVTGFRNVPAPRLGVVALVLVAAIALVIGIAWRNSSVRAARGLAATAKPRTIDPEAEQLYLKGVFYFNKRTPEALNQAVDYFTQAVVRDPQYAEAYVGMADCYNLLREYSLMPPGEAYPRAAAAAKRAIALDDSLSGAHSSLGFVDFYWSWDVPGAEREFQRALALDPNSVVAHHWYATYLLHMGRFKESLEEIEKAQKLDPKSTAILADKGVILFYSGRTDEAVAQLKQLEAIEPNFLSPHSYLAIIYLATGNYSLYLEQSKKAATILHDSSGLAVVAAGEKGLAAGGGRGMLDAMLKEQQTLHAAGKEHAFALAQTAALLGRKREALDHLEESYSKREPEIVALRIDSQLASLRGEPRFRDMIAKVGLPALP
jgi:tetratricopeptide (TPR) repeat protein